VREWRYLAVFEAAYLPKNLQVLFNGKLGQKRGLTTFEVELRGEKWRIHCTARLLEFRTRTASVELIDYCQSRMFL
jgi:hypothetical protein